MEQLYCGPCMIADREDVEAYTILDGTACCYPCARAKRELILLNRDQP